MIILNYVYENLIHNKSNFRLTPDDEYEKYRENGKYCLLNEFGVKEAISDKILFIYKLGRLEYDKAMIVMLNNPSYAGNRERTGYEIIGHLYRAYKYFRDVIKMDKDGTWGKNAATSLHYAYKMNEHVTRGLQTSGGKGVARI